MLCDIAVSSHVAAEHLNCGCWAKEPNGTPVECTSLSGPPGARGGGTGQHRFRQHQYPCGFSASLVPERTEGLQSKMKLDSETDGKTRQRKGEGRKRDESRVGLAPQMLSMRMLNEM